MKRLFAFLTLALTSVAAGQELQKFEGCRMIDSDWADGDSFPVALSDGKEIVLRLYYIDCNETSATTETETSRQALPDEHCAEVTPFGQRDETVSARLG